MIKEVVGFMFTLIDALVFIFSSEIVKLKIPSCYSLYRLRSLSFCYLRQRRQMNATGKIDLLITFHTVGSKVFMVTIKVILVSTLSDTLTGMRIFPALDTITRTSDSM